MPAVPRPGLRVTPAFTIPTAELAWRFSRSSGPGGQGVNTADSRVELSWNVTGSAVLSDAQRIRLEAEAQPKRQSKANKRLGSTKHGGQERRRAKKRNEHKQEREQVSHPWCAFADERQQTCADQRGNDADEKGSLHRLSNSLVHE